MDRLPEDVDSYSPSSEKLKAAGGRGSSDSTKLTSSCSRSQCSKSTLEDVTGGELLYDLILKRDFDGVKELIYTPLGRKMASTSHPHGDGEVYPLHLMCDYDVSSLRPPDDPKDSSAHREMDRRFQPPASIILAVLEAYPEAARVKGSHGRLPLHHAVRLQLPGEIVSALIRAYPQGLDTWDRTKEGMTPRDFPCRDPIKETGSGSEDEDYEDDPVAWNALLSRPSSCWLQQVKDEENQTRMDEELLGLENEFNDLDLELEKSLSEEAALGTRLGKIEADLRRYEKIRMGSDLSEKVDRAEKSLKVGLDDVTSRLDELLDAMDHQYENDTQERRFIAEFSDDVKAVYEDVKGTMEEIWADVKELKSLISHTM